MGAQLHRWPFDHLTHIVSPKGFQEETAESLPGPVSNDAFFFPKVKDIPKRPFSQCLSTIISPLFAEVRSLAAFLGGGAKVRREEEGTRAVLCRWLPVRIGGRGRLSFCLGIHADHWPWALPSISQADEQGRLCGFPDLSGAVQVLLDSSC